MRSARHRLVAPVDGSTAGHKGFLSSIVGVLVVGSCFSPVLEIDDCSVACSSDAECPPGLACAGGYCTSPGSARDCHVPPSVATDRNEPAPLPRDAGPPLPDETGTDSEPGPPEILPAPPAPGAAMPAVDGGVMPAANDACSEATGVAIAPCALPQPCLGLPYAVTFTPAGEELVWQAPTLPPGLELDVATLTVSGIARDSGSLVLAGADARGVVVQRAAFELVPRSSCSVAFMVDEGGGARLHLADREALGSVPEVVLPAELAAGEGVVDFAFSPNGRWLLVRVAGADGQRRLALYSAPDWREHALPPLEGSVLEYSWSLDDSAVAAVLQTEEGAALGGFRLPSSVADRATDSASVAFTPVPTPSDTRPVWFAGPNVGFLSGEGLIAGDRLLHSAALGERGFAAPIPKAADGLFSTDPDTLVRLEASEQGLLLFAAFRTNPTLVNLYRPSPSGVFGVDQDGPAIPSRDARFSALVDGELLVARSYDEPLAGFATVVARDSGCNALLGWSPSNDRLACVSDGAGGGNLRVYDFRDGVLSPSQPVEGSYVYTEAEARFRRRAFSPDGHWFVFGNGFELYVADLRGSRFVQQLRTTNIDALRFPELAFSPDGRYLTRHQEERLFLRLLDSDRPEVPFADRLPASLPCDEHLARSPQSYCGNGSSASSQVSWAGDSRSFLFSDVAGELQLIRVLPLLSDGQSLHLERVELRPGCGEGCVGRFALQP
jgi:hypothetical protein